MSRLGDIVGDVVRFKNQSNPGMLRPTFRYIKEHNNNVDGGGLVGVEVGVQNGVNALSVLQNLPIKKLYLVDPYVVYDGYDEWNCSEFWSHQDIDEIFLDAGKRLMVFNDKIEFVKEFSVEASKILPDDLDFVYIDGNHMYRFVKEDMMCWYPKIRVGGVLGGHDLQYPGVSRAFVEFMYGKKDFFVDSLVRDYRGNSHYVQVEWWMVKNKKYKEENK